jgi:methyl-accepting chemotaxis protein
LDCEDLDGLQKGLCSLSRGDLAVEVSSHTLPVATERHDEIGQLTTTVNDMVTKAGSAVNAYNIARAKVVEMLVQISRTSNHLSVASDEMAGISTETGRAIDEIAGAVTSVAKDAEHQVRAIADAKQLTEEVAAASSTSAAGARATASAATEARDLAQESAQAVA